MGFRERLAWYQMPTLLRVVEGDLPEDGDKQGAEAGAGSEVLPIYLKRRA